jgi:hypothetical protein
MLSFFFVFNCLKCEVMIDIGGFVDNYCLNYPFITSYQGIYIIHLDTCTNIWLWFGEVVVVIVWYTCTNIWLRFGEVVVVIVWYTCNNIWLWFGEVVVVIVWYLDLPMPSVPITTNVVSSNPTQARCTWYNIMW